MSVNLLSIVERQEGQGESDRLNDPHILVEQTPGSTPSNYFHRAIAIAPYLA